MSVSRPALFGRDMVADPFPFYHQLRQAAPVHWEESIGRWILTRHADVMTFLRDPRLGRDLLGGGETYLSPDQRAVLEPVLVMLDHQMLFSNPPRHTRLRNLVNLAFTPKAVAAMRGEIQRLVDGFLDAVQDSGRMEVIRDLAYPLPTAVIGGMLGVPREDHDRLKRWSDDLATFIGNNDTTPDENRRILQSVEEMIEYFRAAARSRRERPGPDLLSGLVAAEDEGARLTEDELLANAILLLAAGHETTTNLIGNGILALLRHPDQFRLLREEPARIENAVEEVLRYDSPVQLTQRLAMDDLEIGGQAIERGQRVVFVLGAANRDPEQFTDPDRFDITRREIRHVAFGHGPHFCLGAPLARLEGQIALGTMLRRMLELRLTDEPPRQRENFGLRGLEVLPVAF